MINLLLMLIALFNYNASYNIWTDEIKCINESTCAHEMAHKIDANNCWISETQEFKDAIDIMRSTAWICLECRDKYSEAINFFPGVGRPKDKNNNPFNLAFWQDTSYRELYAYIYQLAKGDVADIPGILQPFYILSDNCQ